MRNWFLTLALLASACASLPSAEERSPLPPSLAYPDLFERVAMSELYEPKDWTDMRPLRPVTAIEADYDAAAPLTDDELRAFVEANFAPPETVASELDLEEGLTLKEHIEALWTVLTRKADEGEGRGTLLPLPNPYVVPGGRFREVYYWDTYFTMLGLDGEAAYLREEVVGNFAASLERYGRIPNGNRSYYLSRSQPPFFYLMVGLLREDDKASAYAQYLPSLLAEHAFWTQDADDLSVGEIRGRSVRLPDGHVLQRHYDDRDAPRDESYRYDVETAEGTDRPKEEVYRDLRAGAESGWDFSSRWWDEGEALQDIRTTRIVPADLNALLYGLERAIEAGCQRAGDRACREEFTERAGRRAEAIGIHLWSDEGYYADLDLDTLRPRARPTAAMLYPLFTKAAEEEKAAATLRSAEELLLGRGGILPTPIRSGEQWDAPNGWAPHQWIAIRAAEGYGRPGLAEKIAASWLRTVARGYCESGKLTEKYDILEDREGGGGEYPNQDGFGWTNGVTARLLSERPELAKLGSVRVKYDAETCLVD
jgi:alpha,alpha-trehalase